MPVFVNSKEVAWTQQRHIDKHVKWYIIYLKQNKINTTSLNIKLSFCGPSDYKSEMLKKLHRETQIQTELPTSHCYILREHVAEKPMFWRTKKRKKGRTEGRWSWQSLYRITYLAHAVAASGIFVGGWLCGVKLGPCLLEAICARQALNPTQITPSVHNDCKFLRRRAERDFHQVVTAARRHRTWQSSTRLLFVRFYLLHSILQVAMVNPAVKYSLLEPLMQGLHVRGVQQEFDVVSM